LFRSAACEENGETSEEYDAAADTYKYDSNADAAAFGGDER